MKEHPLKIYVDLYPELLSLVSDTGWRPVEEGQASDCYGTGCGARSV